MSSDSEDYYSDNESIKGKNDIDIDNNDYNNNSEDENNEIDKAEDESVKDDEIEDNEPEQIFTIKSPEYINYKKNILSLHTQVLDRTPVYHQYQIKDYKQVNIFADTVKEYGNNLPIIEKHYTEIGMDLVKSKNPFILGNIKLIEYTEYETSDYTSLIEIIDGHHRVRGMCIAFAEKPNLKLSIDVEVYKSDKPDSEKTNELFRKFNVVKPFLSDINITDVSRNIIYELNKTYIGLPLIKNCNTKVNRPRISQTVLNQIIGKRLLELKENGVYLGSLNIENIIKDFKKYNEKCKNKCESWFRKNVIFACKNKSKISNNIMKLVKEHNCYLGLVDLEKLVELCIN